jgi:uncharacterized protein
MEGIGMSYRDEDLEQLDALLRALPQDDAPMTLSELNGYLTGVLASPGLILPSEWLAGVWSEDGTAPAPEIAALDELIEAVMGHYNAIVAAINVEGLVEPVYEEDVNSGETLWEPWVDGFVRAMRLREAEWLAIANGVEGGAEMAVNGILALQDVSSGTSDFSEEALERLDREAPDMIPELVAMIFAETRALGALA